MATGHGFNSLLQVGVDLGVVQDRLGVHANVVVDDELKPRQAHARVGQLGKVKCQLGVAHVHHDLGLDGRHRAALHFGHFGFEQAVVDLARVALGAAHRDQRAVFQALGRITTSHHGRNAQLARNDGRVAGAATAVGDDGAGALHHGFPVGVRHVGHQHIAGLDLVHLGNVVHQAHRAGADLLANGAALGQHRAVALELVAQFSLILGLALHGFRACLQDVELAVGAVLTPLDVHGAAIVLLNHQRVAGQLLHISVGQRVTVALLGGHINGLDQLATGGLFLGRGEHHLDQLAAQVAADQRLFARLEHGLVHIELVGVHGALHHGLAQAVAAGDEHHVFKTGFGVDGEHHTCRAQVGTHHALHASGQGHHVVLEALVHAVGDGAVVVQRREHFLHLVHDFVDAHHVQEGFLLAGKRGVGQILGRGGRAHGKRGGGVASTQLGKFVGNGFLQVSREGLCLDHGANLGADLCESAHVLGVQALELGADAVGQAVIGQELAERVGGGSEARGHAHALRQLGDHFAEAGVFTANGLDIGHSQVFKRYDQGGRAEKCRHGKAPEVETGSACRALDGSWQAAMHGLRLCRCGCGPTRCMVRIG